MNQLLKMALRDLGRNKRRSILSALAVSIATTLLIFMASIVRGEFRGALQNGILLQTGHLQVRSATYEESKVSLAWEDLVDNPAQIADQLKTLPQVVDATPRLLASGIISLSDNSRGVQVLGIDPNAEANQIFRQGVISGEFLTSDDREGILIGKPLADKFNLNVGDQVNLLINTSNGDVDEQAFTVRGIYTTNVFPYDENTVFMPLAKAQAFAGAEDHASLIFVLLNDQDQTESVAAALSSSNYQIVTWQELNELSVEFEQFAGAYMVILYLIILGITATVVTNTLVMAVYERTREIGVLSAIGMKGGRIMLAFLTEAALLATGGVIGGLLLGGLVTLWVGSVGMTVPATQGITGILIGDKIYPFIIASDVISLTVTAYVITLMASLYPALLAARMEPVEALHAQ
ncbi:MAG TPA: ABC transporter permease [Anaerolineales bacterium]|nr:ABC transporter permease [Anaerolineales bacterium]HNC07617.1 ABC transporter permease [Anaerolineales bacterium]